MDAPIHFPSNHAGALNMKLALLALLALSACAPTHPLTYVHPGDPTWWATPPTAVMAEPARPPDRQALDWRVQTSPGMIR
jgi:hypothetical protein